MTTSGDPLAPIFEPKVLAVCAAGETVYGWLRLLYENRIQVIVAVTPDEAERLWAMYTPDLIIIDASRLRLDALSLCQRLRGLTAAPIMLFTEQTSEDYHLAAYKAGVDECALRPHSAELFLAKVKAWLRRARSAPAEELNALQVGGFRLEPRCRELRLEDGRRVHLSLLELRLLLLLMSQPGRAVSSKEILWRVWGYQGGGSQTELKNVVYRLRHKIEPDPHHPQHLLTEGHWGYRWVVD